QSIKRVTATLQHKNTDSHQHPSRSAINRMAGSKNIHISRTYTDFEVDAFIDEAFDYMQQYFQESMQAVQQQNPHVQTRFSPIDAQKFSAEAYANGSYRARCMI